MPQPVTSLSRKFVLPFLWLWLGTAATHAQVATTQAATGVTDITATLNGTASAASLSGHSGGAEFEYGTTTSYAGGYVNAQPNLITGSVPVSVSASLPGLLPNTLYHFRIVIGRDFGTGGFVGDDMTFTTGPPATPPFGISSSFFLLNQQVLTPTANAVGVLFNTGSSRATLSLDYGTSTAYGTQVIAPTPFAASTTALNSFVLTSLTPATTYHFRVTASNNEGATVGADNTFTTPPLPDVSTSPVAYFTDSTAVLAGVYNPQGGIYTVSFDYGTTTAYGSTMNIDSNPFGLFFDPVTTPQLTGVILSGLSPMTSYHYRLKLTDYYGNNYYGADSTFSTISPAQSWRRSYFNTIENVGDAADSANPAGDGIVNLMKYALGLNPLAFSSPPQPYLRNTSGDWYLSIIFYRNTAFTEITYAVEVADSPAGPWTSIASSVGGAETSGSGYVTEWPYYIGGGYDPGATSVMVQDTIPASQAVSRFMRLRVTR